MTNRERQIIDSEIRYWKQSIDSAIGSGDSDHIVFMMHKYHALIRLDSKLRPPKRKHKGEKR
jgi:hypothetical protein